VVENEMRGERDAASPGTAPIDNRIFVLILQHPQERKEVLATAATTCAMLRRAALVVGLSWPNLARALGRPADASRWAVLYLGSARPAEFGSRQEVIALGRDRMPILDRDAALRDLDGVVVLDGSWSEAKTLWWRNPWLLKLRRIVLNPRNRARFSRLRREPRPAALSTIEAVALLLKNLEGAPEAEAVFLHRLNRILAEASTGRKGFLKAEGVPFSLQARHE